jgi:tetratricopeptide (TPR) repeat protein
VRETAVRELESALQQYPSSPMAAQGAFELGNLRYASRQYAQARAAYEIAVAKASRGTIATLARTGIGYTWEAERNFGKAADTYRAALGGLKPQDFFYEELLFDLGRTQEQAGQKNEAIETYRRLVKEMPRTARAEEARARLATLGVAS